MKKISKLGISLIGMSMLLVGCGSNKSESETEVTKKDKVIKVATALDSSEEILEIASKKAEAEGYTIEVVRVNDNVQYNTLLKDKEVDANLSQHEPFMEEYNEAHQANLVIVQNVYDAKVGFYSKDYQTIEGIPKGGKIALPNDASNQGRALAILADQGLITLKEDVGFNSTVKDVVENPKEFEFLEIDLLNLASAYDEKGMVLVYNYPTYLTKIGLTPDDALFLEEPNDNYYAISVAAREDNMDSEKINVLKEAVASDEVRDYLVEEHGVSLVPSF